MQPTRSWILPPTRMIVRCRPKRLAPCKHSSKAGPMRIRSRAGPATAAFAAEALVPRVGDRTGGNREGGNRSPLAISGCGNDLPDTIARSDFPAAPILEARKAGALDGGDTGDLSLPTACAPITAIGGTKADPRSRAIPVRAESPFRTARRRDP